MYKKIGILGGTFDPFHKGHFMLAKTAYEQFELDEVWIMPNGNPPHKKEIEQTEFDIRCEMIRLATAEEDYMKLCLVEESEEQYHYTYQTLEYFHRKYPEYCFYFIIGADSLNDFPTWKEPGKIAGLCTFLVACRDESGMKDIQEKIDTIRVRFGAKCRILNSPKVDAASSEIREMVLNGKNVSQYVGKKVSDYIQKHGLYKSC